MFKPTTFGKFFLYEKLAIGGMAEIFKAKLYGIAGFEKTLVVKQILPEYASDAEFVKMFIDEANIAVSLTHGNIVPVFELGKIGDRYYIAMEYVDGENLETIVDQCRRLKREIPVHLGVEIAIEVCKGLDYAHKKQGPDGTPLKIVHRDISPQNVMVSFDGEVKLVDFGIAKAASKLSLTRVGTLKGKFGYMSPEQAAGGEVDGRTDIYAAGIVLWEMLTSTRLFDAESDLDLLKRVRAGAVMPPRMVAPRVPEALERIVLKALTKDLGERYQQAGQLQLDLQRWLYSRQPEANEETLSSFMRSLFRRESSPRPTPPPVPQIAIPPEPRRQRDVSYAQSDEIARALVEAANEARKVIVDERPGAEPSFDGERATNDQAAVPSQPELDNHTAHGFGALVAEESGEPTATHTASGSGEGVLVEATSAYAEPTNTASDTSDLGDVIEWDETTDKNVQNAARLQKASEFVERATVEGPIVRIPRRPGAVGIAPWDAKGSAVPPPWNVGPIPAPPDDSRTTPGGEPTRVPMRSVSSRKAPAEPAPSFPGEEPLFAPRRTRGGRAVFATVAALALLAGGAAFTADRMGLLRAATPAPSATATPADDVVAVATTRADVTATATATAAPVETPVLPAETPAAGPTSTSGSGSAATPRPTAAASATPKATAGPTKVAVVATPRNTPKPTPVVAYGTVSVQAIPWGEVKIDGVKVKNTPLVKHRVKAGSHTIVVTNPDLKKSETRKIVVRANTDEEPIVVSFE